MGVFVFPTVQYLAMGISVISSFVIIRHHDDLGTLGLMVMSVITLVALLYQLIIYYKLSEGNQLSIKLKKSWVRNLEKLIGRDRKLLAKYAKSSRPIRMEIGNLGYFKKSTCINSCSKVVYYVTKLLLMTK